MCDTRRRHSTSLTHQQRRTRQDLTNDSKATVSVLYWYRSYPSLEHPLSYFWILRPAPELAQTLLMGSKHEIKSWCRKGDASSNGALERRLLTLSTFSPATHVQQSAVASNGAVPPPRLVRTAPFDSNGTSPGPVLMP